MKKILLNLVLIFFTVNTYAQLKYPTTRKVDQVDDYHGTKVADPYRWLENTMSAETDKWAAAQKALSNDYLDEIPYRKQLAKRCKEVSKNELQNPPFRIGDWFYFYKYIGDGKKWILCRQKQLNGKHQVVLDPNKLGGGISVQDIKISGNAKYAAFTVSKAGYGDEELYIMDLKSKLILNEKLDYIYESKIAWQGEGFYYSRISEPFGNGRLLKDVKHQIYYHKVNTSQSGDILIFEDNTHQQRFHQVKTTSDEQFAILYAYDRETLHQTEALHFAPKGSKKFQPINGLVPDSDYKVIDNIGDKLLIQTNANAPNSKLILFDTQTKQFLPFIDEKQEILNDVWTAGGKIFLSYSKDVTTQLSVYNLQGEKENDISLPSMGHVNYLVGNPDDKVVFYNFESFTTPQTVYQYNIATKQSQVHYKPQFFFDTEQYETKQVFCTSKDGTKIPIFVTSKKGITYDGNNPTILYGYGGFNLSMKPDFNLLAIPFLEQGGVYAVACLRGGSDYGEKWHEQGIKDKKQNVFDDCIAAAEYLISEKITSRERLALHGASNGGLMVGAVINQRPDLFAVAIPATGLLDMLRCQKIPLGSKWTYELGSSDNAEDFKNLYAYSPLHNVREGVAYPAMMITIYDSYNGDIVLPPHSYKYAATLQEKYKGAKPILLLADTNENYSSVTYNDAVKQIADIYSFILYNMGVKSLR